MSDNRFADDNRWCVLRKGECVPLRGWNDPPKGETAADCIPDPLDLEDGEVIVETFIEKKCRLRVYSLRSNKVHWMHSLDLQRGLRAIRRMTTSILDDGDAHLEEKKKYLYPLAEEVFDAARAIGNKENEQ